MTTADTAWPTDLVDLDIALLTAIQSLSTADGAAVPAGVDGAVIDLALIDLALINDVFGAQLQSRHLDNIARWLRAKGVGFYTIGSAGHESNAWVAAALRPTDPALLHYRSGGFYVARAGQVIDESGVRHDGATDVLLGLLASVDEPISGGRHKVFGNHALAIIPQTSTIASHLPRALGVAFAISRANRLGIATDWPADSVVVCSFGDASLNHSTAQGALNAAAYTAHQGMRLPLLFVCEDNGWGISVPTPSGWVAASLSSRPALNYAFADGRDPVAVLAATTELAAKARETGRPGVLHLRVVRYGGHAGTDVEAAYRSPASMRAEQANDPLLGTARLLVAAGVASPEQIVERYLQTRSDLRERAADLMQTRTLSTASEVMVPLSPRRPGTVCDHIAASAVAAAANAGRADFFGTLPEREGAVTLAESINRTLADALLADPRVMVFGEDVGVKGGVYGVTRGLQRKAGSGRVFDTLLDEQSILGLALGASVSGLVPVPEVQYLAYLHNAEDQLRGEAASLSFFSNGQYRNGMVVRVAGYAYQKGFGGHFHNDNAVGVLRDIPGVVIASPGRPRDAAAMLRTCLAAATVDGTVCVFLEPIARYHTRELLESGDDGWTDVYEPPERWADTHVAIGEAAVARAGTDVLVVSWANGLYMSLRVAARLATEGISCRVLDLRWLAPLPHALVAEHAAALGRVVVVDETRHSGGVGEAVVSGLVESGYSGVIRRVAALDSFIPLGDAANLVLVSEDDIEAAIRAVAAE